jgi:hypothetical protein
MIRLEPKSMKMLRASKSTIAGVASLLTLMLLACGATGQDKEHPIVLEDVFDIPGRETFPVGIVYGPKAAFKISAPSGWVVDNQSGVSQGMPCVLYPKGSTWAKADAVMYAKIASTNTTDRDAFIEAAIAHMSKGNKAFKHRRVAEGKTGDGHAYVINDYQHGVRAEAANSQFERVAYVQLPSAVAFIVFTVPNEQLHKKYARVVQEVVKKFSYEPKYINFGAPGKSGAPK